MDPETITQINRTIKEFFENNPAIRRIPAKDLMPAFIQAGIFTKDHRDGLPIREVLRKLDRSGSLHRIPFVRAERKQVNTNWFFDNVLVGS
jgi:hypothetical protein